MTTHTIEIPTWAEKIDWQDDGGTPFAVYVTKLSQHAAWTGAREEFASEFELYGDTSIEGNPAMLSISVPNASLDFQNLADARAFAHSLLAAADEAEALLGGAK